MLASPSSASLLLAVAAVPAMAVRTRVSPPVMQVQGGSRRTYTYGPRPGQPEEVQFELGSDGRPVDAEFELWQGPGNTPVQTRVYGDDGYGRPIYGTIGTGRRGWGTTTASVRNTGPLEWVCRRSNSEPLKPPSHGALMLARLCSPPTLDPLLPPRFPINAAVGVGARRPHPAEYQEVAPPAGPMNGARQQRIQGGGALRTFTIDGSIGSVQIILESQGMPIYAKVEILQGPNSDRQGIELYSDDGRGKPVSYILELPGYGSTVSITNTGPMEYPLTASVIPYGPQRIESQHAWGGGAYGSLMPGAEPMGGRYGLGDRYGRDGGARRASAADVEAATGRKWHERGQRAGHAPRGPPPRFADMPPVGTDGQLAGGADEARGYGYGAPSPYAYPGVSDGARYGANVY